MKTICLALMIFSNLAALTLGASIAKTFVYQNTPLQLIDKAIQVGRTERLNFNEWIASAKSTLKINEIETMYESFLKECSSVAALVGQTDSMSVDSRVQPAIVIARQKMLQTLGLDTETVHFLTMAPQEKRQTVEKLCMMHEVDIQCANAFYGNDLSAINEKLDMIKWSSGFAKVMIDEECPAHQIDMSDLTCIVEAVDDFSITCDASIKHYNKTKHQIDYQMENSLINKYSEFEEMFNDQEKPTTEQQIRVKVETDKQLRQVMSELSIFEAHKCHSFSMTIGCISKTIEKKCGSRASDKMVKMLKIGYLRRERFEEVNQAFHDTDVDPHRSCQTFY
uniref:DUF725 domain-containing protein n=1 Tax=Rhabditophanes sp. KR3021 TaxID=114890 RepID=A0AC35TRC7_9BILA